MVAITVTLTFKAILVHGPKFEKEPEKMSIKMMCNAQFQRGQAEVYFRVFLSSLPTFGKHRSSVSFHTYVINASFVKFPFFVNGMCGSLRFIASYPTVFFTRLLFL